MTTQTLQLSYHQREILDAVENTDGNLIIQAAAGSGKTTTLRLVCEALEQHDVPVLALAFNKAIATEFGSKLPPYVTCKTLHSYGLAACRNAMGRVKVDSNKWRVMVSDLMDLPQYRRSIEGARKALFGDVMRLERLASLAESLCVDLGDFDAYEQIDIDFHLSTEDNLQELGDVWEAFHAIDWLRQESRDRQYVVSFDDMLVHPVVHDYPVEPFPYVLVDEGQDLNPLQVELLARLAGKGARLIAVGDSNQAIYGFRGADCNAMANIKARFDMRELPLSVCYRCAKNIVAEAQAVVGAQAIQADDNAEDGNVSHMADSDIAHTISHLEPGDLVLCRTNAPLVSLALALIRSGQKATVRGRDIGAGLQKLSERLMRKTGNWLDYWSALDAWQHAQTARCTRKGQEATIQWIDDQADTLRAIAERCDSLSELTETICSVFDDQQGEGVIFSSIHKAKGLEADRVVYLAPELVPHPMALKTGRSEIIQQEHNLDYVARTRAKRHLIYQPLPKLK